MTLSRSHLAIAVGLALGTTVAAAAPTSTDDGGPSPVAECPAPNDAKCVEKGYLDSKCGQRHLAVCKDPVIEAMEKHYVDAKSAPKVKMLRPKKTQMPQHVEEGKYFPYKKLAGTKVKKAGSPGTAQKVYKKADDVLAGMAGMSMATTPPVDRVTTVDPDTAAQFHRNPAWAANGRAVRSCKEYSYARNYGATRFIDAASACKGDRECVFDVAYMSGSPGIADRVLANEDGVAMKQLTLPAVKLPKNDLFGYEMDLFVRSNGNAPLDSSLHILGLEKVLKDGEKFYDIGSCSGGSCNATRKFHDVWDWHKYLHGVTTDVSQAEAEEYQRRRAEFRGLIEQWAAASAREKSHLDQTTVQDIVLPLDMRAHDPFERFDIQHEYMERVRDQRLKFKQSFGPGILNKSLDEAVQQVHGARHRSGGSAMGVLAMPAPAPKPASKVPAAKPSGTSPGAQPGGVGSSTMSDCLRSDGWGLETGKKGPISCRIGKFLRDEWARKNAGQRSCLDLDNPHCDWTLEMFQAGILDQLPRLDAQLADEQYCDAYLDTDTFEDKDGQVAQVTLVKNRLDFTQNLVKTELKAVGEYRRGNNGTGQKLGKDWEGGDYLGDKSWFAAGYEYEVGWEVEPTKKKDGLVCELKGSAHGDMGFDAWIVGSTIHVVEGAVRAEANPGTNGGDARVNAHLKMFDQAVFNTDGWKLAQTFHPDDDGTFAKQIPGFKPRFDIYVGVPISGQLWGELMFGSSLDVSGKTSMECQTELPKFAVNATYMPFFGAFGLGQVGVGIAGVASAGIRASLTLIMLGLPVNVGMKTSIKNGKPKVTFGSDLGLMLATLGGRVSLYVEFLMFDEEFELFRWKGFSTTVPIMPRLEADVSLVGLK